MTEKPKVNVGTEGHIDWPLHYLMKEIDHRHPIALVDSRLCNIGLSKTLALSTLGNTVTIPVLEPPNRSFEEVSDFWDDVRDRGGYLGDPIPIFGRDHLDYDATPYVNLEGTSYIGRTKTPRPKRKAKRLAQKKSRKNNRRK